jgi:hypothetical protein
MKLIHSVSALQIDAVQIRHVKRHRSRSAPGFFLQLANGHDYIAGPSMTAERNPLAGDYLVFHEGRSVIVEKSVIDLLYIPADAICFGRALQLLKRGQRIARASWATTGAWICLGDAHPGLEADKFWNVHTRALAEENGGTAPVHQYIIHAEAGQIQMGWTPSQAEMLAEDWRVA